MKFSREYNIKLPSLPIKKAVKLISDNWFQCVLIFFVMQIFFNNNISIQVKMHAVEMGEPVITDKGLAQPVALKNEAEAPVALAGFGSAAKTNVKPDAKVWKPSDFANLSFVLNPGLQDKSNVPQVIVDAKNDICRSYVERFARVAISEAEKFNIPASITLAQGLLESNAGSSKLALESQNHFGLKCKPKCLGCTCRNYRDDEIYDMFRVFDTAWESYREHSDLLSGDRYAHLKNLGRRDYKGWAHGLKKAGYATDAKYAEKLIMIIEVLDLYQFDV